MVDFANVKSIVGHTRKVHGKGTDVVAYKEEIKGMSDIFYMLGVKNNVLFVRAIIDVGYVIMLRKNTCWIVVATSLHKILVVGHKYSVNGLYKLELKLPKTHQQASSQFF